MDCKDFNLSQIMREDLGFNLKAIIILGGNGITEEDFCNIFDNGSLNDPIILLIGFKLALLGNISKRFKLTIEKCSQLNSTSIIKILPYVVELLFCLSYKISLRKEVAARFLSIVNNKDLREFVGYRDVLVNTFSISEN